MWVNVFISLVSVQSWSRVTGSYRKVIVNVSQVAQTVKNVPAMQDTQVRSGKSGMLQFMGSNRAGHDLVTEQQQQFLRSLLDDEIYDFVFSVSSAILFIFGHTT